MSFKKIFCNPFFSFIPLFIFGGISIFLYLKIRFFAWNLVDGELDTLFSRIPSSQDFFQGYFYMLFLFFGLNLIWSIKKSKLGCIFTSDWVLAIIFFLSFSIILMSMPPLTSQDIFWNLFHGKIFSFYHKNPYLVSPQNFPYDPSLGLIRAWRDFPMTHGPIWTLIVSLVYFLAPHNLFHQLLIIRGFLFLILISLIALSVLIIKKLNPQWSFPTFIALAWHPLLLMTLNNAHNDILIALTSALGLFLIFQNRYFAGFITLWIGVLVKYVNLLLIPLGLIFVIRRHGFKIFESFNSILAIIIFLTFFIYLPFGYNFKQFSGPTYQTRLFEYTVLPPFPFWLTTVGGDIFKINLNPIINKSLQVNWLKLEKASNLEILVNIIRILSLLFFAFVYFWLIFKPFKKEEDLFKRGFLIFASYLLIAPFWFMSWYLIWLIPLATISGLWPTLITLGWSFIAFPYPFPMLQIITALFSITTFLVILILKYIKNFKRIKIN